MKTPMPARALSALLLCVPLACEPADEGEARTGADPAAPISEGEAFLEAVPEASELTLVGDEDEAAEETAAPAEEVPDLPAAPAEAARIRALVTEANGRIRSAVAGALDRVRDAASRVDPVELRIGGLTCKRWQGEGERAEWRLTSCLRDARIKAYAFSLEGRPLDAEGDEGWSRVMAGEGRRLPAVEGRRRGAGLLAFDLDAHHALTGEGPTGKVAIGYRRAGRLARLHVGVRDFARAGGEAWSGRYRFDHLRGEGGRLRLAVYEDLLTRDEAGDLARGEDGQAELGRVAIGWRRGLGARAALQLCGGTVGQRCVTLSQCWTAAGVTHEAVEGRASFGEACAAPPFAVDDAPAEAEVEGDDAEVGEPAAEPEME